MKVQKILVFGKGQMGGLYERYFSAKGKDVLLSSVDITQVDMVAQVVKEHHPDLIINVAGKTNIDWCEINKEEAFRVNVLGAKNVALAAEATGSFLLHYSSGCVQESVDALDVKTELDIPDPLCHYAWTKVWAENLVLDRVKRGKLIALIVRPRQLISSELSRSNALIKMLTYSKFIDTPNSCTVVDDLLRVTDLLIRDSVTGIVNIVNPGITSPLKIARVLKEYIDSDMSISRISKTELNSMTRANRIDAVLSGNKLETMGVKLMPIEDRLKDVVKELKEKLLSPEGQKVLEVVQMDTNKKLQTSNL